MIHVSATIAGLDALAERIDEATKQIVADAAHLVQRASMEFAPVGTAGNTTNTPGDLRRSIRVTGPEGGDGTYVAQVAPWIVYGRQRELGGTIRAYNPSGLLTFVKFGQVYRKASVYQVPHPYLEPGRDTSIPAIEAVAIERLSIAVKGG